jgi:hypothetical protein
MSDSNFNPQNTSSIPVVKIFVFLELEPRLNIKTDLTGQAKLNIFQRSQLIIQIHRSRHRQMVEWLSG